MVFKSHRLQVNDEHVISMFSGTFDYTCDSALVSPAVASLGLSSGSPDIGGKAKCPSSSFIPCLIMSPRLSVCISSRL